MLQIDEKWRIVADKQNIMLQHRQKCHGEYVWNNKYYYGNLAGALNKYLSMKISKKLASEDKYTMGELITLLRTSMEFLEGLASGVSVQDLAKVENNDD